MERIDLLWDAWEDCLCKEQLRAEFGRLTAEVDRWQKLADKEYWGRVRQEEANKALQSQLDKISAPIKGTQRSSTRGGRGCSDSDREAVDRICAYLDSHDDFHGNNLVGRDLAAYLAKQKPSEKPPPCPECQGTKYINRVVSVTDWEWHRYYMIVDCLNCSGAKG